MEFLGDFPNRLPFGEALGLGGSVALMGVSIVFLGLVFLIIITMIYPKIINWLLPKTTSLKEKRKAKKAEKQLLKAEKKAAKKTGVQEQPAPVQAAASASEGKAAEAAAADSALIAVLTAAVAASLGTSSNGVRIRSFRRSGTPAWGKEGKYEQFKF